MRAMETRDGVRRTTAGIDPPGGRRARSLASECLVAEFGPGSAVAQSSVHLLTQLFANLPQSDGHGTRAICRPVGGLGEQGPVEAASAMEPSVDLPSEESGWEDLAALWPLPQPMPAFHHLLRAVRTYYALVVHAVVAEALGAAGIRSSGRGSRWGPNGRGSAGRFGPDRSVLGMGSDVPGWTSTIQTLLSRLAAVARECNFQSVPIPGSEQGDLFRALYESLFPRRLRHALGEYYTPDWLARFVLDEVGYTGQPAARLLDPACGSGVFLVEAIRRYRASWAKRYGSPTARPAQLLRQLRRHIFGVDLNPLAVLTAQANYRLAVRDLLRRVEPDWEAPVYWGDSLFGRPDGLANQMGPCDFVVGNPPWIAWDHLRGELREATKSLWRRYGLFSLSGIEARHGGAKKDISMLMVYVAADRYLKPSGRLAMLVTQSVFQTLGAGDGFRRFRLGSSGPWLGVLRVHDLVDRRPFQSAANRTAVLVLKKGRRTHYPVSYVRWSADGRTPEEFQAAPVDPQRPTSPWFLWPSRLAGLHRHGIGPSDYRAHLGANTGGANGVYWVTIVAPPTQQPIATDAAGAVPGPPGSIHPVRASDSTRMPPRTTPLDCGGHAGLIRVRNLPDRSRHRLPTVEGLVETELLYPLLRWADVARYRAVPRTYVLLVQDVRTRRGIEEGVLRARYPRTYRYFEPFRDVLSRRAAYRRYLSGAAFYSMYDVGPYTLAPIKVVWRRMDRRIQAAVVEPVCDPYLGVRAVIPQETCVLVAVDSLDEAHYLCAVLNSSVVGFLAGSHHVRGGKGFGSPAMLGQIAIRRYEPSNPAHRELASLSRQAHALANSGADSLTVERQVEQRIDILVGGLWGLDPTAVHAIRSIEHCR